jgi:hypothetical protein
MWGGFFMDEKLLIMEWITPFLSSKKYAVKFLQVIFSFLLLNTTSHAASFGSIPLVEQAEHAPFVIRGFIEGQTVELERSSGRPYTYWKFRLEEQLQGPETLSGALSLRQPGGEINGMGYQVSGRAEFTYGEHVVVMAKKTNENGILEVYGLASGKYTVSEQNGKQIIESGLGSTVTFPDGKALTLTDFRGVISRVKGGDPTGRDLSVVVNREAEQNHTLPIAVADLSKPSGPDGNAVATTLDPNNPNRELTIRQPSSEKSLGISEDIWTKIIAIFLVLVAFLLVVVFFVRKLH